MRYEGKPYWRLLTGAAIVVTATGCAVVPPGPSAMVLPGSTKSFDQFRADDAMCRAFAQSQSGTTGYPQAQQASALQSTVAASALGAAAGAAIDGGHGAAVGAGAGAVAGSLHGLSAGAYAGSLAQDRYDNGYIQCMYAQGHRVPVPAQLANAATAPALPPAPYMPPPPPPPPPGAAPPPAPR